MKTLHLLDRGTGTVLRFEGWQAAENSTWSVSGRMSRCAVFRRVDGGIVVGLDMSRPPDGFEEGKYDRVFAGLDWAEVKAEVLDHDFRDAPRGAFWLAWNRAHAQKIEEEVARCLKTWKQLGLVWP
jgi:hypothetical protein